MFIMLYLYSQYKIIFFYSLLASSLGCLIIGLNFCLGFRKYNLLKILPYECGFEPFEDTRNKFYISFYIIGMLFLIFDIEIIYLFPWLFSLWTFIYLSLSYIFLFLLILILGFFYELYVNALEWE